MTFQRLNRRAAVRILSSNACARPWLLAGGLVLLTAATALAQPAAPAKPAVITDPTILALLETNPTTPPQLVQAIDSILNLGQPAAAVPLVQKLLDAQLDDASCYALVSQFGSDTFLRMGRTPELTGGVALANGVIEGAARHSVDPQRLKDLVSRIPGADDTAVRAYAGELRSGGAAAVSALLTALAQNNQVDNSDPLFRALLLQGSNVSGPAIAALDSDDPALRAVAARALGDLKARKAIPFLVGPAVDPTVNAQLRESARLALQAMLGAAPSRDEVVSFLYREARRAYAGAPPDQPNLAGLVEIWVWDPATESASARVAPSHIAAAVHAERLATELYPLAPDDPAVRRLFIATLLERASYENGLERRLPTAEDPQAGPTVRDIVARFGVPALLDTLGEQLDEDHTIGATATCRILGEIGDAEVLWHRDPNPSLLAVAAAHADTRLRFAGAEAMMRLAPNDKPFPGAALITQNIEHFAHYGGTLRAVVAETVPANAQSHVGLLAQLGFEGIAVTNGRDCIRQAVEAADVAFILLDTTLPNAPPDILIQKIRHDPRSARLPIGLIAPVNRLDEVRRLARRFPRTAVMVRPHTVEAMDVQLDELFATAAREMVSPAERLMHARSALNWVTQIAWDPNHYAFYDLRRMDALLEPVAYLPELTAAAAPALASLGTARAQSALVAVASQNALPLASRQAAAQAFHESVKRDGVLLRQAEIFTQYDRYNASSQLDEGTQQVLASILDSLEMRLAAAAANQEPEPEPSPGAAPAEGHPEAGNPAVPAAPVPAGNGQP